MMRETVNILLTGAGNHPVMLAGSLIARAAYYEGLDAKNTSVIALGVIGGAVVSQVRFGDVIQSPLFPEGQGDYMIGFDKLEALRNCEQIKSSGTIFISDEIVPPTSVTGLIEPPFHTKDITKKIMETEKKIVEISTEEVSSDFDKYMALLGAFSNRVNIGMRAWTTAMKEIFEKDIFEVKKGGFEYGRNTY